jgi:hypothetical protein
MVRKIGVLGGAVLALKLRLPTGVKLSAREADAVIGDWSDQLSVQDKSASKLKDVGWDIERQVERLKKAREETSKTAAEARRYFQKTKNPVKKEVWARRLVLAMRCQEALIESEQRLNSTIDRVKGAVADAALIHRMLDTRIREATIYKKLNGGLHLVGQALAEARTEHKVASIEYTNFELNMEGLEKSITADSRDRIIKEAQQYLLEADEEK